MHEAPDSECRSWTSLADLLVAHGAADAALLGLPLAGRSLTPGRCDLGPRAVRETLPKISTYDLETSVDLRDTRILDAGDLNLKTLSPSDAFEPIRQSVAELRNGHALCILLGGNNAITRPAVHAIDHTLESVGVLTLDAHFDLRDTDCGLTNGNPIQALLDDGIQGQQVAQVGLAPFANTARMHRKAIDAGITVFTASQCFREGTVTLVGRALDTLAARCERIFVDFDIDVIERAMAPGAPGARPGGIHVRDFFAAARLAASHPKVAAVDLTEFDPSLDLGGTTALIGARWVAELLAGLAERG